MLDFNAFDSADSPISKSLSRRGVPIERIDEVKALAAARRESITHAEGLKRALNEASDGIKAAMQAGKKDAAEEARGALRGLKSQIAAAEATRVEAEATLERMMLDLPNVPDDSVPDGKDERDNVEIKRFGAPRSFNFEPQNHWDIGEKLGILSFTQAAQVAGARFAVLHGAGAKLERALAAFMLDHAQSHGFSEVAPPLLVKPESMVGAAQYPKFRGEAFETQDGTHVLIPTSEVPLVNLHRDEVLADTSLPRRYTAYTPCFRREAGAAGRDTRGLIRLHQFNKVELVAVTRPEDSAQEHERLTRVAEGVLEALALPYRRVALCSGDMGFASAKTYDLEVWLPGQNAYREISSCSNCHDFQARRSKIRFRPDGAKSKPQWVHTLNGSSLAVGRTLVAVLENYQNADGSVDVPEVIRPYMNQQTKIQALMAQ